MLMPFKNHHFGWKGVMIPFTCKANFELKSHLGTHVASKLARLLPRVSPCIFNFSCALAIHINVFLNLE